MRIRSAVFSLVLIMGLAGGALTATSASAGKVFSPCSGSAVLHLASEEPSAWPPYDHNANGYVCVSGHKIADDHLPK
jgi:hypothetical protein